MGSKWMVAPKTWYVYTYAFPGGSIFYIGKGNGGRIDEHEREAQSGCECTKCQTIREIWASGHPVQKRIVYETLLEAEALEYEKTLIHQHAGPHLTNQRLPAHQRILEVASDLFYHQGIRAVGIDTIVEKSGVGKATLYRHFPTKDALIAAYLEERDRLYWKQLDEALAEHEEAPKAQFLALIDIALKRMQEPHYRGCVFLNALAEFAEEEHPAHQYAVEHKRKLHERLYQLGQRAGVRNPEALADQLSLLLNGALASMPVFGLTGPVAQLKTVATQLIDAQLTEGHGTNS